MSSHRKPAANTKVVTVADNNWFKSQVTAGNLLSVATVAFGFAGFYYNTASSIEAQAKEIASINRKLDASDKKDEKQQREVLSERTTLRAEMTNRAEKTADSIAELSKQNAVLSTQLSTINGELIKLGQQLANIAATTRR
jgi:septal ring factor EnvC (AmiA/AmiB activator)